jgi:ParB-like chromosome segregation protein Spo0J
MRIEERTTDSIQPYEKNPRQNHQAVEAVANSIAEFGFRQPIVIDPTGTIVIGHVRWLAAQKLGLQTVPVHVAETLTAARIQALRVADNKLHELSEWNLELLSGELAELKMLGVDLDLLGFSKEELSALFDETISEGLTDADAIPEPPDEADTQPGDLWILGEHRLLCGDSSVATDVDLLLDGALIHMVNTESPL